MLNLDKNDFDFWMVKWLKALILVWFDDIVYDMGVEVEKLGFCLILLGIWEVRFLSWYVEESAIWISEKTSCRFSFCHPLTS